MQEVKALGFETLEAFIEANLRHLTKERRKLFWVLVGRERN